MEIRANIAETVRRVMEERGKTLPELSAELDIPLSSMKNYAKGAKNLRADTIDMLAWKLGLTPAELISQLPSGWAEAETAVRAAQAFGNLTLEKQSQGIELFLKPGERHIRTMIGIAWRTAPQQLERLSGCCLERRPRPAQFLAFLTYHLSNIQ